MKHVIIISIVFVLLIPNVVFAETVSVSGSSDLIGYTITGGKLLGITPDSDANSLIISIDATDDGSLTLTIPRSILDAKINGIDDDFFVLSDGEEVDFDETTTSTDRILTIPFPAGAEEIEIIGTFVVSKQLSLNSQTSSGVVTQTPIQLSSSSNPSLSSLSFVSSSFPIDVTTDKAAYSAGEAIRIIGEVWDYNNYPISLIVKSPNGNLVTIAQIDIGANNRFDWEFTSGGPLMNKKGTYTITAQNGNNVNRVATTSFDFDGSTTPTPTLTPTPTPTPSGTSSDNFPIEYVIADIVIAVVAVGIGIALSKRKKTTPVIPAKTVKSQPVMVQTTSDETQFWVCSHCGNDTQYKNGKQFCGSCNVYL